MSDAPTIYESAPSSAPPFPPPTAFTPEVESIVQNEPPVEFPPLSEPASAPKHRGRGVLYTILVAVLALLLGAGVGYAIGVPGKNRAVNDKNAAQEQVTSLQQELSTVQASAASVSSARDTCSKAATDAGDLLGQWDNFWSDYGAYLDTPVGSAAEASMKQHMNDQLGRMELQSIVVEDELSSCRKAVS